MTEFKPGDQVTLTIIEENGWLNPKTGVRSGRHSEHVYHGAFIKPVGKKSAQCRFDHQGKSVIKTVLLRKLTRKQEK